MLEFNLTPRVVKSIEDKTKLGILQIIGQGPSVTMSLLFLEKGLNLTPAEADHKLEEYLQEKDITKLYVEIMKALQTKGFLRRSLDLVQAEQDIDAALVEPESPTPVSENNG